MKIFAEPLTLAVYTLLVIGITAMFSVLFTKESYKKKQENIKLNKAAYPKWIITPVFNSEEYDTYCIKEEDFFKLYTGQISFMGFLGEGRFKAIYKKKPKKVMLISCGLSNMDGGGIMNMYIPHPSNFIHSEIDKCFVHGICFRYIIIGAEDYHSFMNMQPQIGQIVAYDTLIAPGEIVSHWHDICIKYSIHFLMANDVAKQ